MVSLGLTWVAASTVAFLALVLVVQAEQKRGKRFLLGGFRGWFDKVISTAERRVTLSWDHFSKYIVQLGWYYSIHSVLRTLLKTLVSFYDSVERVFERNRTRTKQLRAEKQQNSNSHLAKMAEHKAETALTPAQQRRLKAKELKGD